MNPSDNLDWDTILSKLDQIEKQEKNQEKSLSDLLATCGHAKTTVPLDLQFDLGKHTDIESEESESEKKPVFKKPATKKNNNRKIAANFTLENKRNKKKLSKFVRSSSESEVDSNLDSDIEASQTKQKQHQGVESWREHRLKQIKQNSSNVVIVKQDASNHPTEKTIRPNSYQSVKDKKYFEKSQTVLETQGLERIDFERVLATLPKNENFYRAPSRKRIVELPDTKVLLKNLYQLSLAEQYNHNQ